MASPNKNRRYAEKRSRNVQRQSSTTLRIVGGTMRGRLLQYSGDQVTRPMKDRTREAVFNLLGPSVSGADVVDWFSGTGALAFEAISRGAVHATLVERHIPTWRIINKNIERLAIEKQCRVERANAFFVADQLLPRQRRTIHFFSPPYDMFVDQTKEIVQLIQQVAAGSAAGSQLVIESDHRFDYASHLTLPVTWRVRKYPPAVVAIGCLEDEAEDTS